MAFRRSNLFCPSCNNELSAAEFAVCARCNGAWVSEAELIERIQQMGNPAGFDFSVVFTAADPEPPKRDCPLCGHELDHLTLGPVVVDRCGQNHGIWFDAKELAAVLHASAEGNVTVPGGAGRRVILPCDKSNEPDSYSIDSGGYVPNLRPPSLLSRTLDDIGAVADFILDLLII